MTDHKEKKKEEREVVETSEAQIAVHWQEESYFEASPQFIGQANMTDPNIYERFSLKNFPNCFKEYGDCSPGTSTGIRPSIPVTRLV